MKNYTVNYHERWTRSFSVRANSPEEAVRIANQMIEDGDDSQELFEYTDDAGMDVLEDGEIFPADETVDRDKLRETLSQ